MGKIIGIDLGTTNSCRRGHGGWRAQGHPQRGRRADYSVRRGIHQDRGTAGRTGREAPGDHQPRKHDLSRSSASWDVASTK